MLHRGQAAIYQQTGTVLVVSLVLLTAITLLTFSVAQTSIMEQRMSANDYRIGMAEQAAQAGLEYAAAYLSRDIPIWNHNKASNIEIATPNQQPPLIMTGNQDQIRTTIYFQRNVNHPVFIKVTASASAISDPSIMARAEQYIRPGSVLTTAGESSAPFVIDGCIQQASGRPDIVPAKTITKAASIASSKSAACQTIGKTNLYGGNILGHAFTTGKLWSHLFAIDQQDFQKMSASEAGLPDSQRNYWWATGADLQQGQWKKSLGSVRRPIVLVIPANLGCPIFGSGAKIVGLVYIEAGCPNNAPWGKTEIIGHLAIAGNLYRINGNLDIRHISRAPGGTDILSLPPIRAPQVLGTWKDF